MDVISNLQRLGYLEYHEPKNSTIIKGDIHPIFKKTNWLTTPDMDTLYTTMEPALTLASRFLQTEELLPWWEHVLFDVTERDPKRKEMILRDSSQGNSYNERPAITRSALLELADNVKFTWLDLNAVNKGAGLAMSSIADMLSLITPTTFDSNTTDSEPGIIIGLDASFASHLRCDITQSQQLRLQFLLATTMVRQVAHAWYMDRHGNLETSIFPDELVADAGQSWERHVFGALVHPATDLIDETPWPLCPLAAKLYQDSWPYDIPIMALVPQKWVQQWFLDETWADISELRQREQLELPTTHGHPEAFVAGRYKDGRPRILVYTRDDYDSTPRPWGMQACDSERPSLSCPSLRHWYAPVWEREALAAFLAGELPRQYFQHALVAVYLSKNQEAVGRLLAGDNNDCLEILNAALRRYGYPELTREKVRGLAERCGLVPDRSIIHQGLSEEALNRSRDLAGGMKDVAGRGITQRGLVEITPEGWRVAAEQPGDMPGRGGHDEL